MRKKHPEERPMFQAIALEYQGHTLMLPLYFADGEYGLYLEVQVNGGHLRIQKVAALTYGRALNRPRA